MGDLTRTFGGLIIMAHRVNSQTLFALSFILACILRWSIFDCLYVCIISMLSSITSKQVVSYYSDFGPSLLWFSGFLTRPHVMLRPFDHLSSNDTERGRG